MRVQKITLWLALATLIVTALRPSDAHAQTRGRLENSSGIVIFKRYAWSPPEDLLAAEFLSYVDRRAEFQTNRGYIQFRLPQNQLRQVGGESIVDIVHFTDLAAPIDLLTASDERAMMEKLAKAERLAAYSEGVAAIIGPYLTSLKTDLVQFSAGRVKQDGVWRDRSDHVASRIEAILAEVRAGGILGRKELESRVKEIQSEGHSGPQFERSIRELRESWFGIRLQRAASVIQERRGRAGADLLDELRMDIGSTPVSKGLQDQMRLLGEQAGALVLDARRADLLLELRNPLTNEGRKGAVLRELDAIGVTAPDDLAWMESVRESLQRRQSANLSVQLLTAETNSLFDTASLRRAESGAYFKTGDTNLRDLSTKLSAAWQTMPSSETEARTALADLQSLIETAGQLSFHLAGKDWKAVPGLLTRLRDISDRTGAGQTFVQNIGSEVAARRVEVNKITARAAANEAAGNRSEALMLYIEASEMLPDEKTQREVKRLSQQALGL